jgi:hypothetical protein
MQSFVEKNKTSTIITWLAAWAGFEVLKLERKWQLIITFVFTIELKAKNYHLRQNVLKMFATNPIRKTVSWMEKQNREQEKTVFIC